ncbi:hypothetical protein DFQ14_1076 [Halopolyspora algeriensis]|uniref:Uncharacterized protein n=1 Tax=Halopolyspora algeriensis TaxID=1500506 RepID=A0A368VN19_9ACTN|nr:hypothetical protein DFQ14_1076 [Halopolyspora algeriensis]TQM56177.1 hypothetical protein FHU43_0970 [Halopolyspora algeriensis]
MFQDIESFEGERMGSRWWAWQRAQTWVEGRRDVSGYGTRTYGALSSGAMLSDCCHPSRF